MTNAERVLELLLRHEVDPEDDDEAQHEHRVYWKQIPLEELPADPHQIDFDIDELAKDPASGLAAGSVDSMVAARGTSYGFATGVPVVGYVHHRAVATARFRDGRLALVVAESVVDDYVAPDSVPMELRVVE
jgi:hypothetical protein